MEMECTNSEYRLSAIISALMKKMNITEIEINLVEELRDNPTPVLMLLDLNESGSHVRLYKTSHENAEMIELLQRNEGPAQ